jgi:hypothetical protein
MNPEDPLRPLLAQWKSTPVVSPNFQSEVWREIARREELAACNPWRGLWERATLRLQHPACALALVLLCAVIGFGAGQLSRPPIEQRYALSLDPYWHASR